MYDNLQMQNKRNNTIDIIKAVAIILVCIGHSIQFGSGFNILSEEIFFDNICFKIIYSFHMPLFMLISGYLFYFSVNTIHSFYYFLFILITIDEHGKIMYF